MKLPNLLLTLLLSAATAWSVTKYTAPTTPAASTQESAFERVMRTGVLRCGYYVFPPATYRDPTTGKLSGLSVDMMELFAKNAALKIEWAEETDFNNWHMGLGAKRFDAMCTPMWPDSNLARIALFTQPFLFSSINAYARNDDHRFDNTLSAANYPNITIVSYENDPTSAISQSYFPKAKHIVLAAGSPTGLSGEYVATKKADLVLWDENGVFSFNKNSPHKIRNVAPSSPLKVMPFELLVGINEPQLRDLLDIGLQEMLDSGDLDKMIDKWQQTPQSFFRIAKPYEIEER